MFTDDQQVIEAGSSLTMYRVDHAVLSEGVTAARIYECKVLTVMGKDTFKLSLPSIYEEPWMPSLDGIYAFSVVADENEFSGKGKILERFRDQDGDCCIFKQTEALSISEKKEYLNLKAEIPVQIESGKDEDIIPGIATNISLNVVITECEKYIDDGASLRIKLFLEPNCDIIASAVVSETIRLRKGNYQSRLLVNKMDIRYQKELAAWILQNYRNYNNNF